MNDDTLRAAYQPLLRDPGNDRGDCPPPEALEALVHRTASEAARLATLDHVMTCAACRRELDLLRAVEHAVPAPTRLPRWFAAAATITVVLGAGLLWRSARELPDPMRGSATAVTLVAPDSTATRSDQETVSFIWRAVPDAMEYQIELLDGDDRVAFSRVTADTSIAFDASTLNRVNDLRWRVVASLPAGGSVASPYRRFTPAAP